MSESQEWGLRLLISKQAPPWALAGVAVGPEFESPSVNSPGRALARLL